MNWLTGKKTYIAAGLLALLGVCGLWFELLPPAQAAAVLMFAFGLCGVGHKLDRYAKPTVELVELAKELLKEYRASGKVDLESRGDAISDIVKELKYEAVDEAAGTPRRRAADLAKDSGPVARQAPNASPASAQLRANETNFHRGGPGK